MMIGVIGLGNMGSGITATLIRSGYGLVVYDLDETRTKRLAAEGARPAGSVATLCELCDTVILSLPSSHVAEVVLENEVLPSVRKGSVVIDMGTTLVRETRRLFELFKQRGVSLVDAPVSGGSVGAAKGELFVFAGGDEPAVKSRWEVLKALGGARLTYCGPSGCGQITKAVNQLCMGLVSAAYIEATAFGVNAGVDAQVLADAVGGDRGFREQFRQTAERIAAGYGDDNDVKYAEHAYFLDHAQHDGFPMPMLSALYSYMKQFPETRRDNMNRPYPPLWSSLAGGKGDSRS